MEFTGTMKTSSLEENIHGISRLVLCPVLGMHDVFRNSDLPFPSTKNNSYRLHV